jgi:anti-repressor protein
MDALIAIGERAGRPTVSARDLHAFLGSRDDFSTWVKTQLERARLVDGRDYDVSRELPENLAGGRPRTEYHLSLDAGKHIAMMAGTDKAFEVRDYFIECERRALAAPALPDLSNPATLRGLLLNYSERVSALETTLRAQRPKVAFAEAIGVAEDLQKLHEVAKVLGQGPRKFLRWLVDSGVLVDNKHKLPYQVHIDAGRFRVIEVAYKDAEQRDRMRPETRVTGRGITFLQQRLTKAKTAEAA